MGIFLDECSSDQGWSKVGSWVDSTQSVSSNVLNLTVGAGGRDTSAWRRTGFEGLNASITVRTSGGTANIPQIHFRESSSGNYLIVYIDPADASLHLGKVVAGVYTEFDSVNSSITSGGNFTFKGIVYGNMLYGAVQSNDGSETIFKDLKYISSDVSAFTGIFHGLGVTSSTQKYDWVDMRTLTSLTNVVCVGDSNVGGDNRLYWPNLLIKRHWKEGFVSENQGVGGWSTQDIINAYATKVDPFAVTGAGADNVLIIATGNNDFAVDAISPTTCHTRQLSVITHALTVGYNRFIIPTLIPFPYADRGGYTSLQFVDQLNTLIRDGAATEGYTLCEIHNAFGAVDGQLGVSPSTLVNSDQIHYSTASGHPLAAQVHSNNLLRNYRTSVA